MMNQTELNEMLKMAEKSSREELIMLITLAIKDYMQYISENGRNTKEANNLYFNVKMCANLIIMKENVTSMGIPAINKKIRDIEFTNNLFNTRVN